MLFGFDYGSYFSSMFIAFSFVLMMCGYACFAKKEAKLSGYVSMVFAAVYAAIVLLVYFTQLTTVRLNDLTQQAVMLLDFQQCGLLFNYDLLGYAVMALATFFAGLTIKPQTRIDKWLKYLLIFLSYWYFILFAFFKMQGIALTSVHQRKLCEKLLVFCFSQKRIEECRNMLNDLEEMGVEDTEETAVIRKQL